MSIYKKNFRNERNIWLFSLRIWYDNNSILNLFYLKILSMEKKMDLVESPVELNFYYDLKIENEIKKSIGIFEKFVSPLIYSLNP